MKKRRLFSVIFLAAWCLFIFINYIILADEIDPVAVVVLVICVALLLILIRYIRYLPERFYLYTPFRQFFGVKKFKDEEEQDK